MKFSLNFTVKDEVERERLREKFQRHIDIGDSNKDHAVKILDYFNSHKDDCEDDIRWSKKVMELIKVLVIDADGKCIASTKVEKEVMPGPIKVGESVYILPNDLIYRVKEAAIEHRFDRSKESIEVVFHTDGKSKINFVKRSDLKMSKDNIKQDTRKRYTCNINFKTEEERQFVRDTVSKFKVAEDSTFKDSLLRMITMVNDGDLLDVSANKVVKCMTTNIKNVYSKVTDIESMSAPDIISSFIIDEYKNEYDSATKELYLSDFTNKVIDVLNITPARTYSELSNSDSLGSFIINLRGLGFENQVSIDLVEGLNGEDYSKYFKNGKTLEALFDIYEANPKLLEKYPDLSKYDLDLKNIIHYLKLATSIMNPLDRVNTFKIANGEAMRRDMTLVLIVTHRFSKKVVKSSMFGLRKEEVMEYENRLKRCDVIPTIVFSKN